MKAAKNTRKLNELSLLTIAFVVLKLCHVINWSWWLVLLPTILPVGIGIIWLVVIVIIKCFRT